MGIAYLPFQDKKSAKAFKKHMAKPWIAEVENDGEGCFHWDAGELTALYSDDDMGMYLDEIANKKKKNFDVRPYVKEVLKPIVEWVSYQLELKYGLESLNLVRESLGMKPLSKKRQLNQTQKTFTYIRKLLIKNKFKISRSTLNINFRMKKIHCGIIKFKYDTNPLIVLEELKFIKEKIYDSSLCTLEFSFRDAKLSEINTLFIVPLEMTRKVRNQKFHEAAVKGDMKAIVVLFKISGKIVDTKDAEGSTPLHKASRKGHLDVVKFLIENGANVNAQTTFGGNMVPLHWASGKGHLNVVKLLVENGANVDAQTTSKYKGNMTPLHWASEGGHLNVAKFLIKNGAKIDAKNSENKILLHLASMENDLDQVKFLIKNGAKIDAKDEEGVTPLHMASERGHLNVAKFLIKNGANVNAQTIYGGTPLHFASNGKRLNVVKFLIENGANVNAQTTRHSKSSRMILYYKNGKTPLHMASGQGCLSVVKFLIKNGAKVNIQTISGTTPLHFVISGTDQLGLTRKVSTCLTIAELLIKSGARVDVKGVRGQTPLHLASMKGQLNQAELLIENGADINAKDKRGRTSLHLISENDMYLLAREEVDIARFLIKNGANVMVKNNKGKTPFDIAKKNSKKGLMKLFKSEQLKNNSNKRNVKSSKKQKVPITSDPKTTWVHLKFKKGKSDKFWFAKVIKNELHTRFGRTGTKGRNSIKKFKSRAKAKAALYQKISEKKKKGYKKI